MATYTGVSKRKKYTLGQPLASGGEGTVYEITGDSDHVAKIYKPNRFTSEAEKDIMERKLKAMLAMNIPTMVDGLLRLAWPQDILYEKGKIVGFVMPRINTKYKIFDIYRTGKNSIREREFTNYTWKYSVQFAYNMAWVVSYLHRYNIVIGDLNQNNIAVDIKTGAVILIDCDSFDIRDPISGEHFPCVVGLEEILAPELQTVGNLRNGTFTKESDNFSLAIHIFRLLMNNEDPFGGAMTTNASLSTIPGNRAIINGECLYVRDVPGKKWLPRMPKLDILPLDIQQLFRKTFHYTATTALSKRTGRATAAQWVNALARVSAPEPNPNLKRCAVHNNHVYPAHNNTCPWCAVEKAIQPLPAPVKPKPRSYRTAAKTSSQSRARRSSALFYIVLILFGAASGLAYGDTAASMASEIFGTEITVEVATAVVSLLGILCGGGIAHSLKHKYTHARNGFGWLLLGVPVLFIPMLVLVLLGLAVGLLAGISSGIAAIVVVIFVLAVCNQN